MTPAITPTQSPFLTSTPTFTITPFGTPPPTDTRWPTPTEVETTIYDFAANVCLAQWMNGAGSLPCPGMVGDSEGFVQYLDSPKLEDGTIALQPGLITFPQMTSDGYIRGIYPAITVQRGDHFNAIIGCENGAATCSVLFRLDCQIGSGPLRAYWAYGEQYNGENIPIDVDLNLLIGEKVNLGLAVFPLATANDNRALWVAPRIVRR
jgi:hypothetical protein